MTTFRETAGSVKGLTDNLRGRTATLADGAGDVMTDLRATLKNLHGAADSVAKTSDQLDGILIENRTSLHDFRSSGLYELSQFIVEARVLTAGLTRLTAQIERDPARFFLGDAQKGFEAR